MYPIWEEEAQWIWHPDWREGDETGAGSFVYFRKTFELKKVPEQSLLRVSADSRYRLFVNGILVGRGPCKGDRYTWYYDELDVHRHLAVGRNVIAAQVLRYPYDGEGNMSVWRTRLPGLYVHASIRDEQGEELATAHTDASWRCIKDEAITLSQGVYTQFLGITEHVEGARRLWDWESVDCDTKGWAAAQPYAFDLQHGELKPWELRQRPIPFLYETPRRFAGVSRLLPQTEGVENWGAWLHEDAPIEVPAQTARVIDIDAGELTTGYLALAMSGGAGAEIRILCAECYENEPILIPWLRSKGDRTDAANGDLYGDLDVYRPAGTGRVMRPERYEPYWFRTFRFIRLEIITSAEPITLHSFIYRETGYPLEVDASYRSSEREEQVLWDISVRTLKRCMHETYEDCPYYEQLQYVMDTRSQILFTYSLSGDDRLARRTLHDFYSSLIPDGLTQSRYPSTKPQVIPGFSLYWILMLHDHMMFAGDQELVERYMNGVDAVLGYFHRLRDGRGLVGPTNPRYWDFVDWADRWRDDYGVPEAAKHGPMTVYNLMYSYALQRAAELAAYVGRSSMAEEYRQRSEALQAAVRTHCMSATHQGCLTDGPGLELYSQHAQIWAVLSGTFTGDEAQRAMIVALESEDFVPSSFAMAFYLFRALAETELYDRVNELLEPWRVMAGQHHLTTWMEDTVSERSDAHAWGSVPIYEYTSESLGVQSMLPGYGEILIRPRLGRRIEAAGRVMTAKGAVDVEWQIEQDRFRLTAHWPADVPCTLQLPDGQRIRITSGGRYEGIADLRTEREGSRANDV